MGGTRVVGDHAMVASTSFGIPDVPQFPQQKTGRIGVNWPHNGCQHPTGALLMGREVAVGSVCAARRAKPNGMGRGAA